jgi:hypothetical protein
MICACKSVGKYGYSFVSIDTGLIFFALFINNLFSFIFAEDTPIFSKTSWK